MAKTEIRIASRAEVEAIVGSMPYTVKAVAGVVDGKVVGVGGLYFIAGQATAFCDLTPEAKKVPVLLHKAGLAVLQLAKEQGYRYVFAEVSQAEPTAFRWLSRLGFEPIDEERRVMLWRQ